MLRKRVASIIGVIAIIAGGLTLTTATPAHAQTYFQWCTDSYGCLNNWGDGPYVKNYYPRYLQNAINVISDPYRCNRGASSTNCPIRGNPIGLQIVELQNADPNSPFDGQCLGDFNGSSTDATVSDDVACDNGGANGGWGIVYLYVGNGILGCPGNGSETSFVNAHWTGNWSTARGLGWGTSGVGTQVYQNVYRPFCGTITLFS